MLFFSPENTLKTSAGKGVEECGVAGGTSTINTANVTDNSTMRSALAGRARCGKRDTTAAAL